MYRWAHGPPWNTFAGIFLFYAHLLFRVFEKNATSGLWPSYISHFWNGIPDFREVIPECPRDRSGSTGRLTFVRDFNVQTARMELAFAATWAIDTLLYCVQKPNDEHGDPIRSSGAAELLREFTR